MPHFKESQVYLYFLKRLVLYYRLTQLYVTESVSLFHCPTHWGKFRGVTVLHLPRGQQADRAERAMHGLLMP